MSDRSFKIVYNNVSILTTKFNKDHPLTSLSPIITEHKVVIMLMIE